MHEMSLAEGILNIMEEAAAREGFARVKSLRLEVGRLAGVEVEALRFCFGAVVKGSVAEGARLDILDAPGEGWCMQCAKTVPVDALYDACPDCGGYQVQATGGLEMRVLDLEVE
ncbi:MAG: hydrogenase maturation nickel metallochaperone HypA [Ectothiorhodospiraceae bacterium]|jgi:hydrogenase nickel incorporation protein HypA/HybF|nr:hydrogenase maturation nickel metallochaperone HypA [Ectothiorhodospiraceae bacterium]